MLSKLLKVILAASALMTAASTCEAQDIGPGKTVKISIDKGQTKELAFKGRKGEFWQLKESSGWVIFPDIALIGPDGSDLLEDYEGYLRALVLPADGDYKLRFSLGANNGDGEERKGPYELDVVYSNILELPRGSVRVARRTVAGYTVEIWQSKDEYLTALKITRSGRLEAVIIGESSMPFRFADESAHGPTAAQRRAAQLWRTPDKTGDGVPDIAIEYFSGGAHCCFDMLFYELGKEVRKGASLSTADSAVAPMRRNPNGGLRLRTADMSFAYWNMSYAGSPAPIVVLDFKNGVWRTNFSAMRKPAPPPAVLRKKAEAARKLMTNDPYKSDDAYFEEAFWREMLDLIYTGNEVAAWKYFDMVWPASKPGKETFLKDFKDQLNQSQFWKMIQADSER